MIVLVILFGAISLWAGASGLAAPPPTSPASPVIEVQPAPGCVDVDAIAEALGRGLDPGDSPVTARLELRRGADDAYDAIVRVEVEGRRETRSFRAPSCRSAVEAAALAVRVTLEALRSSAPATSDDLDDEAPATASSSGGDPGPPPEVSPVDDDPSPTIPVPGEEPSPAIAGPSRTDIVVPPPAPEPATPEPTFEEAGSPPRTERPTLRGGLEAHGGLAYGVVPGVAGVLQLGGLLQIGSGRLSLTAVRVFPTEAFLDPGAVEVGVWGGTLQGGYTFRWRRVAVPLAIGVVLAAMRGAGQGVEEARPRVGFYGAGQVGAGVRWVPHRRVSLGPDVAAGLAFARPQFGLASASGEQAVGFSPAFASVWATFAVDVRFP